MHLTPDTGDALGIDPVIPAAGRRPATDGTGLERLGIALGHDGSVPVDHRCQIQHQPRIRAAGDLTGPAPCTHGASYQARVLATNLPGGHATAGYRSIPHVICTEPALASAALTEAQARDKAPDVLTAQTDLAGTARASTDSAAAGQLILTADRAKSVLIGASALGPGADSWIAKPPWPSAPRSRWPSSPTSSTPSPPSPKPTRYRSGNWRARSPDQLIGTG